MKRKKKRKGKPTKESEERKALLRQLKRRWKQFPRYAKVFVTIVSLVGLFLTFYLNRPSISVYPHTIRAASDPMATLFAISNDNRYSISDIHCQYFVDYVDYSQMKFAMVEQNFLPLITVPHLDAGESLPFSMHNVRIGGGLGELRTVHLRIAVSYFVFGVACKDTFKFRAFRNYAGVYEWSRFPKDSPEPFNKDSLPGF